MGVIRAFNEPGWVSEMDERVLEGSFEGRGYRFGIVASKFNRRISDQLLSSALQALTDAGVAQHDIEVVRVPGAFEIPLVARRLADSGRFHAVVCLGAVIRGDTPHFEYISMQTSFGIAQASLLSGRPVIFGVLTTDTVEQAMERSEPQSWNRGAAAAMAAVEMATLFERLDGKAEPSAGKRKIGARRRGRT